MKRQVAVFVAALSLGGCAKAPPAEVPVAWAVYQGDQEIDALSALHIARDPAFEEAFAKRIRAINRERRNAKPFFENGMKNTEGTRTLGFAIGLAGFGGALATMLLGSALQKDGEPTSAMVRGVSTGILLIGGSGFGIVGTVNKKRRDIAEQSYAMANAQVMPDDFAQFTTKAYITAVAERYNASLLAQKKADADAKALETDDKKKREQLYLGLPKRR